MTITTPSSSASYQGNNATTVFPFSFYIPLSTEIVVVVTDTTVNPNTVTVLNNTQYSVSGIGNLAGGSVTYPLSGSPLATGKYITIQRVVPYTQPTSIVNQGGFYPDVLEAAIDNVVMQTQQLADAVSRAVVVPAGSTTNPSDYIATLTTASNTAAAAATSASASASSASTSATSAAASATTAANAASVLSNISVGWYIQTYASGTNFTPGSTTTLTLTTTPIATSASALIVNFNGLTQQSTQYTYNSGTGVITFSSAIPVGTTSVECRWASPLPINTPGAGTVSPSTLSTGGPSWNTSGDLTVPRNLSVTGSVTGASAAITGSITAANFSGRNRIINGDFRVSQYNVGNSISLTAGTALAYVIDRFWAACSGANVSGQRVAGTLSQYVWQFTGAASNTGVQFGQRIESLNCADLAGTTATLSVDLATSASATVTWTAYYANSTDSFGTLASPTKTQIATGTFNTTSTATRYSAQISVPGAATTGIEIVLSVSALLATATFTIGRVQFESGNAATVYEFRDIQDTLARSQRYYQTSYNFGTVPGTATSAGCFYFGQNYLQNGAVGITSWNSVPLPVKMRSTPTITTYSTSSGTAGKVRDEAYASDVTPTINNTGCSSFTWTASANGTGSVVQFSGHYTANAEL